MHITLSFSHLATFHADSISNVADKLVFFSLSTFRFLIGQYVTIHGDVISHVNISHVMVEDGGEYSCIASNRAGKISHSARLNVYGKLNDLDFLN